MRTVRSKRAFEAAFQALYAGLNAAQKKAVDTIEGPTMVIAGPGTGKTHILTLRIANILRLTDTPPDAILALTFTESAAHGLKRRLVDIVGPSGYRVMVKTFHGFASHVIDTYPDSFPRIIGARPIHPAEKLVLLMRIIDEQPLEKLRPLGDRHYWLSALQSSIAELKRAATSADDFREAVAAAHAAQDEATETELERLQKARDLSLVYSAYEAALREEKRFDFEDMILELNSALKRDQHLARLLQEQHQYILADEHQDANEAQNGILSELARNPIGDPNIFIVGDDKQAIYRFQGASLDHFTGFLRAYPSATVIDLTHNYRSGQAILDAAHSVIEHTPAPEGRTRTALTAGSGEVGARIKLVEAPTLESELQFVASDVRSKIALGVKAHDIAVLARTNADAAKVATVFEKTGIPHAFDADRALFEFASVRFAISYLRAIVRADDEAVLVPALLLPFSGVTPADVYRLTRVARSERVGLIELATMPKLLARAGESGARFKAYMRTLSYARVRAAHEDALSLITDSMRESGLIAHVAAGAHSFEELEALRVFVDELEALAVSAPLLPELLLRIDVMQEYGIGARVIGEKPRGDRVRILTAHRAKGLEFAHVYIVRAEEGVWGSRRAMPSIPLLGALAPDASESVHEERRLFYVALTRGKEQVTITHAAVRESGTPTLASQFVKEIHEHVLERVAFEDVAAPFDPLLHYAPRIKGPPVTDRTLLAELFDDQGLSVSALNNYLKSPWLYFFRNLLRIPDVQNPTLLYGTAIHAALKDQADFAQREGEVSLARAHTVFERTLWGMPVSRSLYDALLTKGTASLAAYFSERSHEFLLPAKTELKVELFVGAGDSLLRVRGDVDKLLETTDGRIIIDYKTGKPKSRGDIQGTTKSKNSGDMYRQLVFYCILLDRYADGAYATRTAAIDFVEPNDRGKLKREVFEITDDEVDALTSEVLRVAGEIKTLAFWDTPCEREVVGDTIYFAHQALFEKRLDD